MSDFFGEIPPLLIPFLILSISLGIGIFYHLKFDIAIREIRLLKKEKSDYFFNETSVLNYLFQAKKSSDSLKECVQETIDSSFELDKKYYTIRPLSEIWNKNSVLSKKINLSLLDSIPSTIVGVGLAITFLLLAIVLGDAGDALSGKNTTAIQNLLNNASSKFWISVSAILCSIVFSIFIKYSYRLIQVEIDSFISSLRDAGLNHFGAEQTIINQFKLMQEVVDYSQTTAKQTDWHRIHFFDAISGCIDQTISPIFKFHFDQSNQILTEIKNEIINLNDNNSKNIIALGSQVKEINQNAIRKMIDDFRHSLTAASSTEIQIFQKTMRTVSDEINQACQNLITALPKAGRDCTEVLQQYSSEWANQLQQSTEKNMQSLILSSQKIGENLQLVQVSSGRMMEALSIFSEGSIVAQNNMQTVQETAQTMEQSLINMTRNLEPVFERTQDSIIELSKILEPASELMLGTFDDASNTILAINTQLQSVIFTISELSKKLSSLDHLNTSIEKLQEGQYGFLEGYLKKIDDQAVLLQNIFLEIQASDKNRKTDLTLKAPSSLSLKKSTYDRFRKNTNDAGN